MPRERHPWLWLAALVAALGACTTEPTEVVLVVDSDLPIPDELSTVELSVWSERAPPLRTALTLTSPVDLPRSLVLYPLSGTEGRFSVTALGLQSTDLRAVVVRRDVEAAFVPGQTRLLRVFLAASCQASFCAPGETCDESGCRPVEVTPSELVPFDGSTPPDPLACVPREELCNDRDDDCDGERDETFAFASDPAACGYCGHTCAAGACVDGYCEGERPVRIAAGTAHTCVLREGGALSCWGWNGAGQVGALDEEAARQGEPDVVRRPARVPLEGVEGVAAGGAHTCARLAGGTVACFGDGARGELGDGGGRGRLEPAPVPGLRATDVAAGITHSCAVTAAGRVACWGSNAAGQLGTGTTVDSAVPVEVGGLEGVGRVTVGARHSCALVAGRVLCWGDNLEGQLGDGTTGAHRVPAAVPELDGVAEVVAGRFHTCARRTDGSVRCWGRNLEAQLGDGTRERRTSPVAVASVTGAVELAAAAGGTHTCARRDDGTVRCWGSNASGQLGDGTTDARDLPVAVAGLGGAIAIAAGGDAAGGGHTCAILGSGAVLCWGRGADYRTGTYYPLDYAEPRPVEELPLHHVPASAP